jgi:hypothetical protein
MRLKLITGARYWWRFWSTRIQMVALALQAWILIDPVSLLGLFNMMPRQVRELLPELFVQRVGLVLFVLSLVTILARNVKQEKIARKVEEQRDADDA